MFTLLWIWRFDFHVSGRLNQNIESDFSQCDGGLLNHDVYTLEVSRKLVNVVKYNKGSIYHFLRVVLRLFL